MRTLLADLRFDAAPGQDHEHARELGFHELAAVAPTPRTLVRMLRGEEFELLEAVEDDLPPSAAQALVELMLSAARARRFAIRRDGQPRRDMSRLRFLARSLARAARAVPLELLRTARLARLARRWARHRARLPRYAEEAGSALYLRLEPTLRWMGEYVGGAATHTTGVINGLVDNGLDVTVIAVEAPPGVEGTRFVTVPPRRVYHLVRGFTYTDYGLAIERAAAGLRADFVYQRYALGSLAGLRLAERMGVPLVQEFNGSEIWVERNWGSGRLRLESDLAAIERRNLLDASLVVVVSDVLEEWVLKQGVPADRVLVNANGADVARLARYRADPPDVWRRRIGRPEAPTVGFIGTFGLWHGVKELPRIAAAVADEMPDVRWVVIGDGVLHGEVAEEIECRGLGDRVLLTGLVEHDHALSLLSGCDVCVSPHVPNPDGSRFFGSPTKLFEYMGLAKPIVASDLEQIGEIVEHERSGLLCPPGDSAAAAAAIARVLRDPGLARRLGAGALASVEEHYSWKAHTRRILDALSRSGA